MSRQFDRLDHPIGRNGTGFEPRWDVFHRLMVRAVHSESVSPHDAMEQAVGRYLHGMRQTRSGKWRSMRQRCGHLRGNILDEGASQRYIDRLHPAADTQHRQSLTCGKMGYIQFEFIASPAHNPEFVLPAFPVQMWRKIGAASR